MAYINTCVEEVLGMISEFEKSDCNTCKVEIMREHPNVFKNHPLKNVVMSYGCESISSDIVKTTEEVYRKITVRVGVSIHAPITCGGYDCHRVFMDLVEYVSKTDEMISSCGCKSAKFNRNTSTIVLDGWIEKVFRQGF